MLSGHLLNDFVQYAWLNSKIYCLSLNTYSLFKGLQYIHSVDLVHLDIKPENIFISYPETVSTPPPVCDSIPEDSDAPVPQRSGKDEAVVYKIGDMGHVTSVVDPHVEEGDCRYMARELLKEVSACNLSCVVCNHVCVLCMSANFCGSKNYWWVLLV